MKTPLLPYPWLAISIALVAMLGLQLPLATARAEGTARPAQETALPGAGSPEASDPDALVPVVRLEESLLDIMMRAEQLGFEGRLKVITPVVEDTFDLEFMAATSVGRVWMDLTPELKTRWIQSFARYTTTKLADQFDRYSGHEFVLKGERAASRDTFVVMTSLERQGKEPVRLDYRVHRIAAGWRIIDIYAKGRVSELALRRSEYEAVLKRGGIEALIESVDEHSDSTIQSAVAQQPRATE